VQIPTWTKGTVLKVWAAATIPMTILAWVVAPVFAYTFSGPTALPRALILALTAGLIWRFVLVLITVRREQKTLRWPVVKPPCGFSHRAAPAPAVSAAGCGWC
jgi:hypothetical protein